MAAKDNGRALSWPDAKSYCENYRGGGYTDWRMPTPDELAGLYDAAKTYKVDRGEEYAALEKAGIKIHLEENVHLTELIRLPGLSAWAPETSEKYPGSAQVFSFHYGHPRFEPQFKDFIDTEARALPVRSGTAATPATPHP